MTRRGKNIERTTRFRLSPVSDKKLGNFKVRGYKKRGYDYPSPTVLKKMRVALSPSKRKLQRGVNYRARFTGKNRNGSPWR